ncbi:MAG: hypothetical protein OEV28_05170 [Nitrospirota bacterium]|nr:hypothetical protein [Nitrospirota bacterium]
MSVRRKTTSGGSKLQGNTTHSHSVNRPAHGNVSRRDADHTSTVHR